MQLNFSVRGSWSEYGEWSECSVDCGGGTLTRSRTCNNPSPASGIAICEGDAEQKQSCNTNTCDGKNLLYVFCVSHGILSQYWLINDKLFAALIPQQKIWFLPKVSYTTTRVASNRILRLKAYVVLINTACIKLNSSLLTLKSWCFNIIIDLFENFRFIQSDLTDIECWDSGDRGKKGSGYRGAQSTTRDGFTCQKWSSQFPHEHSYTPEA